MVQLNIIKNPVPSSAKKQLFIWDMEPNYSSVVTADGSQYTYNQNCHHCKSILPEYISIYEPTQHLAAKALISLNFANQDFPDSAKNDTCSTQLSTIRQVMPTPMGLGSSVQSACVDHGVYLQSGEVATTV